MSETNTIVNIPPVPEKFGIKVGLIVEDDALNQITIKRFIGNRYSTIITNSLDGAREVLKKEKVDIILMDISIRGKRTDWN